MADNWSDWYSGNMAPPLSLPGGGYAPAPSYVAPMSVEDLYRGVYGSSAPSLASVSRPTVPVNPQTGMPYMTTASAKGGAGVGHGYAAAGSADYTAPRQFQANPLPGIRDLGLPQYGVPGAGGGVLTKSGLPPGSIVEKTYTDPLMPKPALSAPRAPGTVSGKTTLSLPTGGFGSGAVTFSPRASALSPEIITLAFDPMSETSGQNMANSSGKPIRGPSGKTYYPTNRATDKVRAPMKAVGTPPPAPQARSGGLMSLFGGGNGGGILSGLLGGTPRVSAPAVAQPSSGPAIYTPSGGVHPGSFYDNSGNDMAFMPSSYRDNPRNSNGGY